MTNKTKKILVYVAAGLIIAGAAIGILVDVCGGVEPEVVAQDSVVVELVDTVASDTVIVVEDSVVAE